MAGHNLAEIARRADRRPAQFGDDVARGQPGLLGRSAIEYVADLRSGNGRPAISESAISDTGRGVARGDRDPEERRPADVDRGVAGAGFDRLDDRHRLIDRNRVSLTARPLERVLVGGRGVDADDLARSVHKGPTGVAGLHVGVDLDQPGQLLAGPRKLNNYSER